MPAGYAAQPGLPTDAPGPAAEADRVARFSASSKAGCFGAPLLAIRPCGTTIPGIMKKSKRWIIREKRVYGGR